MLRFKDLSEETLDKIRYRQFDRFIRKHEGPEIWDPWLRHDDLEFLEVDNKMVLLPFGQEYHKNVTILRTAFDPETTVLTIFFKDTTFVSDPELEMFEAGYIAICEQMPGEEFFITILYHHWFIIEEQLS
ncbi:MAG: hypothetical protein AAF639_03715 [Chloroflexota bacterium]